MKNFAHFFVAIGSVLTYSCFAQSNEKILSEMTSKNDLAVVSYHVEERINKPMGSSITTYNVSKLSLVNTNDLGENNVRIVTPKYGKSKDTTVGISSLETKSNTLSPITPPQITIPIAVNIDVADTNVATPIVIEQKDKRVRIDVIGTYERIMDKGYKTVDMIIKVGNSHFFAGDLILAAKWYDELFAIKTDLEAVYYYRYAQSLKAVKQFEKANEMMKIFETKSL